MWGEGREKPPDQSIRLEEGPSFKEMSSHLPRLALFTGVHTPSTAGSPSFRGKLGLSLECVGAPGGYEQELGGCPGAATDP